MFLRNVGIDLQIHTAPKPKTSTSSSDCSQGQFDSGFYLSQASDKVPHNVFLFIVRTYLLVLSCHR
jgi:hypothetical protein